MVDLDRLLASKEAFAAGLLRYLAAIEPLEMGMRSFDAPAIRPTGWADRLMKTRRLRTDLAVFDETPASFDPIPVGDLSAFVGRAYVLEGMTLGGSLIATEVRRRLGYVPPSGGGFFRGGPTLMKDWRAFQDWTRSINVEPEGTIQEAVRVFEWFETRLAEPGGERTDHS